MFDISLRISKTKMRGGTHGIHPIKLPLLETLL